MLEQEHKENKAKPVNKASKEKLASKVKLVNKVRKVTKEILEIKGFQGQTISQLMKQG